MALQMFMHLPALSICTHARIIFKLPFTIKFLESSESTDASKLDRMTKFVNFYFDHKLIINNTMPLSCLKMQSLNICISFRRHI